HKPNPNAATRPLTRSNPSPHPRPLFSPPLSVRWPTDWLVPG
uniref:Uncharacterized protein n=1 Tax=Aegilops tauschii subsp. strangulata TaxID=200361 RepID=A0A452YWB4_AEGTS